MENAELKKAVETLLFITDQPIPLSRLCQILGEKDPGNVSFVLSGLRREYEEQGRGMQVVEIAEGFQLATRPEGAPFVRRLYADKMTMRLSAAALETLSIVAYKQPLTRAEIEEIRGVEVIAALETLLDKRLVRVAGRKETVGRPLLYGTTPDFLRHFGLRGIEDLPPLDSYKVPAPASAAGIPAPQTEAGTPAEAPAPQDLPAPAADGAAAATETAAVEETPLEEPVPDS